MNLFKMVFGWLFLAGFTAVGTFYAFDEADHRMGLAKLDLYQKVGVVRYVRSPVQNPTIPIYNPAQPCNNPPCNNQTPINQTPPNNNTAPPISGQIPPNNQPALCNNQPCNTQQPPYNNQAPPANNTRPPYNNQTPPYNSQTPPPSNNQTPPYNGQAPPYNNQAPPNNNQTPPYNNQTPPYNAQTPQYGNQRPTYTPPPNNGRPAFGVRSPITVGSSIGVRSPIVQPPAQPQGRVQPVQQADYLQAITRFTEVKSRTDATARTWEPIRQSLQRQGQSLRPEIQGALSAMIRFTNQAHDALQMKNIMAARAFMDEAEKQMALLQKFHDE